MYVDITLCYAYECLVVPITPKFTYSTIYSFLKRVMACKMMSLGCPVTYTVHSSFLYCEKHN